MSGIAKLAVLSLVGDMKDAFHVSVVHLRSMLGRNWPLVIETPAMRAFNPRGSLKMHLKERPCNGGACAKRSISFQAKMWPSKVR